MRKIVVARDAKRGKIMKGNVNRKSVRKQWNPSSLFFSQANIGQ